MKRAVYNTFLVGFFGLCLLPCAYSASVSGEVNKANGLYEKAQYDAALQHYQNALKKDPDSGEVHYNLGTALYKKDDYVKSIEYLQKALLTDDPALKEKIHFNLSNAFYRSGISKEQKDLKGAIADLERSVAGYDKVLANPKKDPDAQHNSEFVKKELERLKEKQKQQEQQQQQQQSQDKNSQDQKQDKQENQNKEDQKDQEQNKDSSGQQNKDQPPSNKPQDQNKDQNKDQDKGKDPKGNEDQKNQDQKEKQKENQKDNGSQGGENKQDQKQPQAQPSDGKQGDGQQGDQQSGEGQSGKEGEMTPKEAQMLLDDYQRNDEPQGMLYFKPAPGKNNSVEKDW